MTLVLRWRVPAPAIQTRWRGPAGMAAGFQRDPEGPIASIIGPPGPPGGSGNTTRFDVGSAATWIIPHGLGRVPIVQVYLASGEQVLTDVAADAANITVTFPAAVAGFVLAS